MQEEKWDIFCSVIDNYGDIGVCWRLARQLADERRRRVRLWVDRLVPFHRICPEIDPSLGRQMLRGVDIRLWTDPLPEAEAADVVIEAFACALPERYVAAMAARARKPVWINLEYLSAEEWVQGCHGLASPHPSLSLIKHFFFPGFVSGTGGVACERNLAERRKAFQGNKEALAAFWQSLGLPQQQPDEARVSLFCYPNPAVEALFSVWAQDSRKVVCLVPEGVAREAIDASFAPASLSGAGSVMSRGSLQVRILPFLEQDLYDRLLWACDCNFVRGEDSFLRAQWASRPLVWHIYPQEDEAHRIKLEAFLRLYCAALTQDAAAGLRALWTAWNHKSAAGESWAGFWRHRAALEAHAGKWCENLLKNGDLASNLVKFCADRL